MKKVLGILLCVLMLGTTVSALANPIQLDLWTVFTGDDGATLQALVDEFNASQNDIAVNHSPIVAADLYTKLRLAVQTGSEVPDMCIIHVERIPRLAADGILTDVGYLFENGLAKENYPSWVLSKTNFDGLQYGIPWDFNAGILYVNMHLVAKYGLESYLEDGYITFDEIKEVGAKVKETGDAVYTTNFYGGLNGYLPRYEELGGVLVDEKGDLVLDVEIFSNMLAGFRNINQLGYASGLNDDAKAQFIGGQLIFYEAGTWTIPTLDAAGVKYTALPMPCYSPETALMRSGSHTIVEPDDENRTEEEDIALAKFIDWLGSNSIIWSTKGGQVALYSGVTQSDTFKALPQAFLADNIMSEHVHVYKYYYWDLLDAAIGHMGKTPIYDDTVDLEGAAAALKQEVLDAIVQQK